MKGFLRLTREAWRFYVAAFGIALILVVSNDIYLISQYKKDAAAGNELIDMAFTFYDKADGYDLVSFWVALAGIVLFLFARHFSFVDKRTMEFQMFWPIKKRTIVIHDYVCSLAVLVVTWLVTIVSFSVTQGAYNQVLIGKNAALKGEAEQAGRLLWEYGSFYLLYLVLIFSLLYLGIIICRNGIAGMVFMGLCWGAANIFEAIYLNEGWYYLLHPEHVLDYVQRSSEAESRELFIVLAGAVILTDVLIVLAAQRRELSKGKWFYFSWIDYCCIVLSGVLSAFILKDLFWIAPLVALFAGISVSGGLLYLRGRGNGKAESWEVK